MSSRITDPILMELPISRGRPAEGVNIKQCEESCWRISTEGSPGTRVPCLSNLWSDAAEVLLFEYFSFSALYFTLGIVPMSPSSDPVISLSLLVL